MYVFFLVMEIEVQTDNHDIILQSEDTEEIGRNTIVKATPTSRQENDETALQTPISSPSNVEKVLGEKFSLVKTSVEYISIPILTV